VTVVDPGHEYLLDSLDGERENHLVFVKRVGPKYPGHVGAHPGTTIQEVLRALIERCEYVNRQQPCSETESAKNYLTLALIELEKRAARVHGRRLEIEDLRRVVSGEGKCTACGHVGCPGCGEWS
jgi:hypothetical protein